MRYCITHTTTYYYHQAVLLDTHCLRFRPRSDGSQHVLKHQITVSPSPRCQSDVWDLEGNAGLQVWFPKAPLQEWSIRSYALVETCRTNPFDYLAAPWALRAPIDYPQRLAMQLQPYLVGIPGEIIHPQVVSWAQEQLYAVEQDVGDFLTHLTQTIQAQCPYFKRHSGPPLPPVVTLRQGGSCRDLAVLWIAACRAVGLAARFVSGYQEGDLAMAEHDLHAWAEAYVPGGGWRGFDPTLGLATADQHVVLATGATYQAAAPVSGNLLAGERAETELSTRVELASAQTDPLFMASALSGGLG